MLQEATTREVQRAEAQGEARTARDSAKRLVRELGAAARVQQRYATA